MMKPMMIISVVVLLAIGCDLHRAGPGVVEVEEADTEHLYAVLMYAQHCPSCSMLDPTVNAVRGDFEDEITFLRFDMSDESTREAARQSAAEHGLKDLYREHENRTGYLVVVGEGGEEELLRLSGRHEEKELRAEFNRVLDSL